MSELSRRHFVKASAGTAAGMTAIGALASAHAEAHPGPVGSDPVIAYITDPRTGEISVMSGGREVTVHDPKLAAQLARAAR